MTEGGSDHTFAPEAEGAVVNGLVGAALLERWWPEQPGTAAAPPDRLRRRVCPRGARRLTQSRTEASSAGSSPRRLRKAGRFWRSQSITTAAIRMPPLMICCQ